MMNKIKNWIKNHRYLTAAGLFLVSICAIAFGFAQFGPQNNPDDGELLGAYLGEDEDVMETDEY
jgi:hypothetical protein